MKSFSLLIISIFCLVSCNDVNVSSEVESPDSNVPKDLRKGATPNEAAKFAWDTFLAINAPMEDGSGTQWENYKEAYDIFLLDAKEPSAWGEPTTGNLGLCDNLPEDLKVLRTTSKVSPIVNETDQAVGGVLIDRDSNLVHYEVYMNKPMFEYVLENQFYNAMNQAGNQIDFPTGSMELKASWRILDPSKDDISRYHTARAIIYIPNDSTVRKDDCIPTEVQKKIDVCSEQLVGLVGLHIVYKTPSNPNFVWMTFEQNDNVETAQTRKEGIATSFYDSTKAKSYCPDNSRQCDCPDQVMTQVTRQNPIPDWVQKANVKYQDSLRSSKSIWQHYQLIGVQWPTDETRTGNPQMDHLANVSMETFNQTASSCIGCHSFARSSNPTIYSDFSWVMARAQNPKISLPKPTGPDVLKYVMRLNKYKTWKTWPNDDYNKFDIPTRGENPHGKSIRIFVNNAAYYAFEDHPNDSILPEGSIVLKENYRTPPPAIPQPSDLVELTIMYKARDKDGVLKWFWMKTPPYGPVDVASFNANGCISCHMGWKGNGDGMLSFNFGKRPVITETPYTYLDR